MPPPVIPGPFTILAQDANRMLRLVQRPSTTILQEFGPTGCLELELNDEGLQVFLRALPRAVLVAALAVPQATPLHGDVDQVILREVVAQREQSCAPDTSDFAPVWHADYALYLCAHCGVGAAQHTYVRPGMLVCTTKALALARTNPTDHQPQEA